MNHILKASKFIVSLIIQCKSHEMKCIVTSNKFTVLEK